MKHLQSISGVLSTNNSLSILDNFLFEIEDGQLTISASDLETTMRTNFAVEAKDAGKICIPAKQLLEMLKTFPEQPLNFQVNFENSLLEFLRITERTTWLVKMEMNFLEQLL